MPHQGWDATLSTRCPSPALLRVARHPPHRPLTRQRCTARYQKVTLLHTGPALSQAGASLVPPQLAPWGTPRHSPLPPLTWALWASPCKRLRQSALSGRGQQRGVGTPEGSPHTVMTGGEPRGGEPPTLLLWMPPGGSTGCGSVSHLFPLPPLGSGVWSLKGLLSLLRTPWVQPIYP